jgi:hypothetical protein
MLFIHQIYKRLCSLFVKKGKKAAEIEYDTDTIFSINIDKDYNRTLNIYIPQDINVNNVMDIAEAYTATIIDMGKSKMAQQTIKALEDSIDQKNANEKLLFDNIIYTFVYNTNLDNQDKQLDQPIVRPRNAFKKI